MLNITQHLLNHNPAKSYKCTCCSKIISGKSNYRKHIRIHTGQARMKKCEQCGFSTYHKATLDRHKAAKHTFTMEKVECQQCGLLMNKPSYKQHLKMHNREINSYECATCKMCFPSKGGLKSHESTHNSTKNWTCDFCTKSYSHRGTLREHIENVHQQKRYDCNVCKKVFTTKQGRRTHVAIIHKKKQIFKCVKCGTECSTIAHLRTHMMLHKEKKPKSQ